ncbi:MAG: N-acetyl-gamma-glutamyl-phosphate reductase [Lentisphaerales bacterium]|nr:N-acetyl-gamma-glutamyl-phosphate reductase [Lentisphaerales bacterium]
MIKAAIIGASGYSGEELLRILLKHPEVEVICITSRQYAGQPIGDVFPRFAESSLKFSSPSIEEIVATSEVAFLALPHGVAAEFAVPLVGAGLKVIDISADYRLKSEAKYLEYYKAEHPAPALMQASVYGSPERKREDIAKANLVACPGCYPTSIVLPLYPLLKDGLISTEKIIASSMSGVSGAGRKVAVDFIFPECNESVRPYGVVGHRHTPEIEQELALSADVDEVTINFIPHLIPVNHGIHSTIIAGLKDGVTADQIQECWQKYYADEPFVRVLPQGKLADTKHVTYTNICEIAFACDPHTGNIILSSAIDNLTKGASGQAVQCMNIMFGLAEDSGL